MPTRSSRVRFVAAIAVAFICGLVFASGFDLTHFGWAQTRIASTSTGTPIPAAASAVETETAFEAVADHVTPAVVSIEVQTLPKVRPAQQRGRSQRPSIEDLFRQFDLPDQG